LKHLLNVSFILLFFTVKKKLYISSAFVGKVYDKVVIFFNCKCLQSHHDQDVFIN